MKLENAWMLDLDDLYKNYLKIVDLLDDIDPKIRAHFNTINLHDLIVKEVDRLDREVTYTPRAMLKFGWKTYSSDVNSTRTAKFENVYRIPLDFDVVKVKTECTKVLALNPNFIQFVLYFGGSRYGDFYPAIVSIRNSRHKDLMDTKDLIAKMSEVFDLFKTFEE